MTFDWVWVGAAIASALGLLALTAWKLRATIRRSEEEREAEAKPAKPRPKQPSSAKLLAIPGRVLRRRYGT